MFAYQCDSVIPPVGGVLSCAGERAPKACSVTVEIDRGKNSP